MSGERYQSDLRLAGVLGPVSFIGAWLTASLVTAAEYSVIHDAISRLAAVGSDVRWLMTGGFIMFGLLMVGFAKSVSVEFGSVTAGWIAANGLATILVAATPLDSSQTIDQLHNLAAISGYVTLAAIPLSAYALLISRHKTKLAQYGLVASVIAGVALVLSVAGLPTGLFQRVGLTILDVWVVGFALGGWRR